MRRIHVAGLPAPLDLLRQIRSELVVLELLHHVASGVAGCFSRAGSVDEVQYVAVGARVAGGVVGCSSAAGRDGCGLGGAAGGDGELDLCGAGVD